MRWHPPPTPHDAERTRPDRRAPAAQPLRRPLSPARRCATPLLIPLAILFLFPFYLIVRNALMTQPEITGSSLAVVAGESPQWEQLQRRSSTIRGADGDRAAQLGDHRRRQPGLPDALRLDGRLRAGPHPGARQRRRLLPHPLDADGPERGDLHPELRRRRRARRRQHALGHRRARALQRLRHLPLPPVLPRLPGRDRRGGPARRARLLRHLPAADPAQLDRDHDGARHPQLHLQLERLPLAAGHRPLPDDLRRSRSSSPPSSPPRRSTCRCSSWAPPSAPLPLVIVFLVMQRYIVQGVRLSGIKG